MSDKKTQELIDLLDETIQLDEQDGHKEDTEEYRQFEIRKFQFNEIKERLRYRNCPAIWKECPFFEKESHYGIDELVQKFMQAIKKCFANVPHAWQDVSRETLVKEICKLLQEKE